MGRIIVLISTTPDGFADSRNVIIEPDFFEFTHSLLSHSDAVVFGRKTFEQFQDRWIERLQDETSPDWIKKMAQSLHDIQKIVFSSTLKTTRWNNSTIATELDIAYIKSFKKEHKGGLLTFGSLSIIESLIQMNVVDDYYFNIQPIIPGKGEARFFNSLNLDKPCSLKYVAYRELSSGAHIIHYQNADSIQNI
ncbi:dihydrofolate reductase family protein [Ferruginibacter sp.]